MLVEGRHGCCKHAALQVKNCIYLLGCILELRSSLCGERKHILYTEDTYFEGQHGSVIYEAVESRHVKTVTCRILQQQLALPNTRL